jgi:hypothetical protein
MAGVIGLGVVALLTLVVLVQPQAAWNAAAEHSKRFWSVWALAFVTVGLVPSIVIWSEDGTAAPEGWALVWLLVCCAGGVLQPALWFDLLETRRNRARRASLPVVPAPVPLRAPSPTSEIRWYAPTESAHPHPTADYTRMGTSA